MPHALPRRLASQWATLLHNYRASQLKKKLPLRTCRGSFLNKRSSLGYPRGAYSMVRRRAWVPARST